MSSPDEDPVAVFSAELDAAMRAAGLTIPAGIRIQVEKSGDRPSGVPILDARDHSARSDEVPTQEALLGRANSETASPEGHSAAAAVRQRHSRRAIIETQPPPDRANVRVLADRVARAIHEGRDPLAELRWEEHEHVKAGGGIAEDDPARAALLALSEVAARYNILRLTYERPRIVRMSFPEHAHRTKTTMVPVDLVQGAPTAEGEMLIILGADGTWYDAQVERVWEDGRLRVALGPPFFAPDQDKSQDQP